MNVLKKGKSKKVTAKTPQDVLQELAVVEQTLIRRQQELETQQTREANAARRCVSKQDRQGALRALARRRSVERRLARIDGAVSTLEFQRDALDKAATNDLTLDAMKTASGAIRAANTVDINQIQTVLDEIADQHEIHQEISDAISNPSSIGVYQQQEYDEDELMQELSELTGEPIPEVKKPTVAAKTVEMPKSREPTSIQKPKPLADPSYSPVQIPPYSPPRSSEYKDSSNRTPPSYSQSQNRHKIALPAEVAVGRATRSQPFPTEIDTGINSGDADAMMAKRLGALAVVDGGVPRERGHSERKKDRKKKTSIDSESRQVTAL